MKKILFFLIFLFSLCPFIGRTQGIPPPPMGGDMKRSVYDPDKDGDVDQIDSSLIGINQSDVLSMTADTSPTIDDILWIINNPSVTPGDRKVTLGNLSKGLVGINETYGSGWNGDTGLPEKDDIYDYFNQFDSNNNGSLTDETWWILALGAYVLTTTIDSAAELETVSNLGAYFSDIAVATNEANFKSITNLEAGTDYYSVSGANAAFEPIWSGKNTASLGTGSNDTVAITFNGSGTDGTATYTSSTATLDFPFNFTANNLTTDPVAAPGSYFYDSDMPGSAKLAAAWIAQYVDGAASSENVDLQAWVYQGGAWTNVLLFDESDDQWETLKGLNIGAIISNTPQALTVTTEANITLTSSILAITGDNDSDSDTIDLQNGSFAGQKLKVIAVANVDSDDTITIGMTDTTCTNCPVVILDSVGDTRELTWTGSTWAVDEYQISVPSFAHFANADATYSDTTTPHVLLSKETKNTILTNYGATEDRVYTLHPMDFGTNFIMMVGAAYQMDLEPDGTEQLWLNGVQMAAGEHIVNAGDTEGEIMTCFSVEAANGVYELHCESKYANWAQATP